MCDKDLPKPPDSGPGASTPVNEPVVACVAKVIPKLVSIAFLDGTDALEVASGTQLVNLMCDAKFVDGVHAKNIDRLGNKPRLKVRFDLPGSSSFKVKCLPGGGNAAYTPTEKARTPQFTYEDQERSYSTEADGTKILDDFFLAAVGKDTYTFEAVDDQGTKARTGAITTHRLIHYVQIKMTGLTAAASSLGTLGGEFAKHQLTLQAWPTVEMEHMPNIGASDSNTFKEKARLAYSSSKGPEKEPYTMAIGYTDHLAVKNPNQKLIKSAVKVGPGESAVTSPILGVGLNNPTLSEKHLWKTLVPGEGWFVSAIFLKEGGAPNADEVPIAQDQCAAVASGDIADKCTNVKIDVSGLPAGTGTLTLEVNWVDRMRGGMSFPGGSAARNSRAQCLLSEGSGTELARNFDSGA